MEFKVEVSSRLANCKLIQVAYLMIPAQIFKTINAGLHSDYKWFWVGRKDIQSTNTEQNLISAVLYDSFGYIRTDWVSFRYVRTDWIGLVMSEQFVLFG